MKKWLSILLLPQLLSCSPKVISYVNENAKFKDFQTFRVVSVKLEGRKVSPENSQLFDEIRNQIVNQMLKRSYEQSSISPDLTLRYELNSTSRSESNNNNNAFNNTFGFPYGNLNSRTIHESILLLELFDQNRKLIWQGSYDLKNERKEKRATKALNNAIEKIFTTYPYEAGSNEVNPALTQVNKKNE